MNDDTQAETIRKPRYRRITPEVVMRFKAEQAVQGNGTAAVEALEPDRVAPSDRAYRIAKKGEQVESLVYIEDKITELGVVATDRLGELIRSPDERVAQKSVHFAIDHVRGKALQRSESRNVTLNIQAVLE